ncbi:hypothetical protein [Ferrovibrio xuzhouensis]|uniref:Uncharacterized protein n=1 Tax=Ferrovibrio xuzhouensis TaxID=1576914 RepID=A0ABV7V9T6_9PROT
MTDSSATLRHRPEQMPACTQAQRTREGEHFNLWLDRVLPLLLARLVAAHDDARITPDSRASS